eukprot:COSAG01_NODE_31867_length_590_cov_0.822811_1_plen_127_part_10
MVLGMAGPWQARAPRLRVELRDGVKHVERQLHKHRPCTAELLLSAIGELAGGGAALCGGGRATAPGTPDAARWKADRSAGTMSRAERQEYVHLQSEATTAIWSISCSAPRPCMTVAAAPPSSTTGDS